MAVALETSPLLDNTDAVSDTPYVNFGYGSRRSSVSSVSRYGGEGGQDVALTVDELLYRLQYAFLYPGYDVENDVSAILQHCSEADIERLLESMNSTPLKIQQKRKISKLIRTEGNLKRRYRTGRRTKLEKRRKYDSVFRSLQLWDTTIARLTAYFGSNVASYFLFVRTLVYINFFMTVLMVAMVTVPEFVDGNFQSNITYGGHFGELSNSFMFYGVYTDKLSFTYNLPLAYFLTWMAANLLCLVFILITMITRYRRSKLSEDKTSEYKFAWRLFCTWDHSITNKEGVRDHRTSLRTNIKELVREEMSSVRVDICTRLSRYVGRLVSNVTVIGLLVGSGYLIYTVAFDQDWLPSGTPEEWRDFFQKYQLTAVVAGLKFAVPLLFQQLIYLEGWHPRVEAKITLARTTVFYIASLLVFVSSLYEVTDDCSAVNNTTNTSSSCCWENEVGEEVFKVILVDLGILVAVGVAIHLTRALVVKCCWKNLDYSRFDVISCVLDVIYGQGLIWLGLYFSPVLAVIGVIKLVIVFYFRLFIARVAMVPPQELFRASSTGNFYLAILLLILFVSLFPMTYAVIEFEPSPDCGPFNGFSRPYRVVSTQIGKSPDWLEDILVYLGTPAVFVPLLILLVMSTVYFKVKSSSYRDLVTELRKQLTFERRVEKRKIFATGRAASGGALSRYTSQESLISNLQPPAKGRQPTSGDVIEEEDNI